MFCDLVGYTRLASKLDPEEVHALLERFFGVVDATVDRFGGVIDKHIGDAAMALFGAPLAHGDDALRAVRAALEIQSAVSRSFSAGTDPLSVHVGLALGEVVASSVGSDHHRGYTVTGEAANVAARLLDRAGAGETFASDEIYRATSHAADYETVGRHSLKGIDDPVQIWRLAGLKRLVPGASPLVGRRAEIAQCRAVLAAVGESSSGAVVAVRGEPGIGKTRFVEEMQSVAAGLGFEHHVGWVLDFGTERGHSAVRTIVVSLLGLAGDAPLADFETAISASRRANEASDDALYLRDLLELPQREEDRPFYEGIDRAARARAKERVVADLIEERARKRPLLLTVEDIHWADADTLSLIQAIARATALSRTALIMTTRIGNDPLDAGWRANAGEGLQLTIDLGPLAPAEAQRIAQSFSAAEAFAAKCVRRAGGNPLFLEQLLRTAGDLVDGKLPTTVQSVILARTDLLVQNDRRAIEAASILGQRFTLANLRALIEDPRYACEALLRNALLRPAVDGLQFVHALVRDGVYASLTRARRRPLHRRAAEIFLHDPVLRAEHLDLAEDPEAARAYLVASKDQSALFRQDQAAALALRGLALATEARDRVDLALQLGGLRLDAGRGEDALEAFRTALAASRGGEKDRLRALIGCAASNRLLARIDDAFAALSEAEPSARAASDDRALAEIYYIRGNLRFARGEIEECRTAHAAALDVALRLASPEWRARALSGLADAQYMDCRMATALGHFSECVELCDAAGLTRFAVPNRRMMGHCRMYFCEFDTALADMRLALENARRIGDSHAEMLALHSIGYCLTLMGRYDEASEIQPAALERVRSLKARRFEAVILAECAELALSEGRQAEALALLREGLAASKETSLAFVGPMLFGLSALTEPTLEAQEAALEAGESLLAKGAVGHNHFWFRRYAIEHALRILDWDAAERHAKALLVRMVPEPVPYATYVARRGQLLARIGRGVASEGDAAELSELRLSAAAVGLRIDALGEALHGTRPRPEPATPC
jgi:class 3 adenylate cyclase/tetratricopeptide (TPR) repeat protein